MKKRMFLALTMLLCLCVLAACDSSEPQKFSMGYSDSSAQNQQSSQGNQPAANEDAYDPRMEEDYYSPENIYLPDPVTPPVATNTPAPTIRGEYAGATPVLLEPFDKPTPTPVPPLAAFTYKVYDATKLGLSFEGPVGWTEDASIENTFIIQNPNVNIDYAATMTLRAEEVSAAYSSKQLETVVKNMLEAIGTAGFDKYSPSQTAERALLGKTGVYANYNGTLNTGAKIAGRVHAVCVDKVLYTVHITYPAAYADEYIDQVFHHMRDTIKITH